MVLTKDMIIDKMKSERVRKAFQKWELDFVYIYGSIARDQLMWWSDIDLAISSSKLSKLTADQQISLLGDIIESLEKLVNIKDRPFDIRIVEQVSLSLQFRIIKEGTLVYNGAPINHRRFVEDTLREYYDYRIWIDHYLKLSLTV